MNDQEEKYLSMKAGLGMDILIAETIMGIFPHYLPEDTKHENVLWPTYTGYTTTDKIVMLSQFPEPYSSDMGAAWKVAEKMLLGIVKITDGWSARLFCDEEIARARLAPLAICRAAMIVWLDDERVENDSTPIRDLSSPGDILKETLEERGMSVADLALQTGFTQDYITLLIEAQMRLNLEEAQVLEKVLGIPTSLWMNLEHNYRKEQNEGLTDLPTDEKFEILLNRIEYLECEVNEGRRVHNSLLETVSGIKKDIERIDPNSWGKHLKVIETKEEAIYHDDVGTDQESSP